MKASDIRQAMVIGTGLMGPGIAYSYATAGCDVVMWARTQESVDRGLRSLESGLETLVNGRCIDQQQAQERRARVRGTTDFEEAARPAQIVTESIVEDARVKQDLFARLEGVCSPETIMTSNTSGIPATLLAAELAHPERFAVTHFWNPPHLMPLVEIVKGERTAQETIETLLELLRIPGKKPVVVMKDTPGQLGNRLFHALIREAIYIVQEGIASAEDVDTAIKNGLGRRFPVYGTLEHQDVVGLDMVLAIQTYMAKALTNSTEPAPILRDKVAAGDLGVKSGNGFYDWHKREVQPLIARRDAFLVELLRQELTEGGAGAE